jgi:AraC-like DNA-binding protein
VTKDIPCVAPVAPDTLSDLLNAVRLRGAVFYEVEATAPWAERQPQGMAIARYVMPGVQHLLSYHVVVDGPCYGSLVGGEPVRLESGDAIVFPHGDTHVMSSGPARDAQEHLDFYAIPVEQLPRPVRIEGGGSDRARLVCGFLGCDIRPYNPLIGALPRVLHIRNDGGDAGWLRPFIELAVSESRHRRAGGDVVIARISELMFVEAIRRYLAGLPEQQTGWLAGLRDPHVGRALAALHEKPHFGWTLQGLARAAGLSRSALAERFTHLIGLPPMQYLLRWRMQVAASALARGSKIAGVAVEVGYESEAAFSRAFKKLVGHSPAAWRERQLKATRVRMRPAARSKRGRSQARSA